MTDPHRHPPGSFQGGRFAPTHRTRPDVCLGVDDADGPLSQREWDSLGFTPVDARLWHREGFTSAEAYEWSRTEAEFFWRPAALWRDAGFSAADATTWDANGFTPTQAAPLAGTMKAHVAAQWRGHEQPDWRSWAAHGLGPSTAQSFGQMQIPPDKATGWHRAGFEASDAAGWADRDFTPDEADLMRRHGFYPNTAREWLSAGNPPPAEEYVG